VPRITRTSLNAYGLAAAAGVVLALALPGPALWPLVLAVPGLLAAALGGRSGWAAFRVGWFGGLAQWLAAVPWVVIVLHRHGKLPLPLALLALLLMAGILGLQWGLAAWAATRGGARALPWLLPLSLAAVEQLQRLPPWIFPWNPVAAVATAAPPLMAPLPVLGAAGLSLVMLLAGSAAGELVRGRRRAGAALAAVSVGVFGLAAAVSPRFVPTAEPVRAAAVQPNVPLEVRWDADNLAAIEARVWRLTLTAAAAGARWIVWPESAIPRYVERDPEHRRAIETAAAATGAWLTVGSIGFGADGESYYNSVFSFAPGGRVPWRYDKVHLVPFGEYVPLAGRIAPLRPLVREVGSFTPGTSLLPLPGPAGPVGLAVCYEVTYPGLFAAQVVNGAAVLATITNDGWYGDSAAPRQHLALAQLRAAESRRWLVRAANTGISALVDPYGRVVERLGMGREGVVSGEVQAGAGVTPAVRHGPALRGGLVALAAAAILLAGRRRRLAPSGGRKPLEARTI
jgi:apolipoprotein N-acyltransferase